MNRDGQDVKAIAPTSHKPSEKYRLYTMEKEEITSATWVAYLRSAKTQKVVLWLKKDTPAINAPNQPDRKERDIPEENEVHHSQQNGEERHGRTGSDSGKMINGAPQNGDLSLASVKALFAGDDLNVLPFLEWPVIDRFRKMDRRSARDRTERHLNSLVNDILVERFDPDPISRQPSPAMNGSRAHTDRFTSVVLMDVIPGQTLGQVEQKLNDDQMRLKRLPSDSESRGHRWHRHELNVAFLGMCRNLLRWFLCDEIASGDNQVIMTFWGAVAILLDASSSSWSTHHRNIASVGGRESGRRGVHFETQDDDVIEVYSGTLRDTHRLLRHLRRETDSFDVTAGGNAHHNASPSHGGVLLLSMVEAFTSILSIFIEGARYICLGEEGYCLSKKSGGGAQFDDLTLQESLKSLADDSIRHLKTARTQLIVEQSGDAHNAGLGPVVTPEAIMLLLMRRLAQGVYEDRTINVVDLYEKCLENLVLNPFPNQPLFAL